MFLPILPVRPPGCGKSTLERVWHKMLGYPCMTMNAAAFSDVMVFAGIRSDLFAPEALGHCELYGQI